VCRNLALKAEQEAGRMSDFEDLCANVLVVSHGGFIAQLLGHFADDWGCSLPGSARITPNAALSRFLVTASRNDAECEADSVWIRCVALHDKDHLANDVDAEALPTSEPL